MFLNATEPDVLIFGEVYSTESDKPNEAFYLIYSIFGEQGEMIGRGESFFNDETFYKFEAFDDYIDIADLSVTKIKIYPKKL